MHITIIHNQHQRRVSYITWGHWCFLLSLVVQVAPTISAYCTPISPKIMPILSVLCHPAGFNLPFLSCFVGCIPNPRYRDKAEYARTATAQILRILHNTSLNSLEFYIRVESGGWESVYTVYTLLGFFGPVIVFTVPATEKSGGQL